MTNPNPDDRKRELRVVVLAPFGRDAALTERTLTSAGIAACVCEHDAALERALHEDLGALLLTEEALARPTMELLERALAVQPPWSDLPIVIVTTRRPDDRNSRTYYEHLMSLGNVTLLERPLNRRSLVSTLASALRARRRQYDARDLLARIEREVARRDQFLAMLGHELRNPLGAIRNVTEILQRVIPPADRTDRQISVLSRQTKHLTRMVDDLLEVSRVSTGKLTLKKTKIELGTLVEGVVQQLVPAAKQQALELLIRRPDGTVFVQGDPVRLDQVFGNLITNAIKYTPAGGRIQVSVEGREGFAFVRVQDTGVGMAPEVLPFVFELFCQVEKTLERSQGGMGIGLTLAHSLAKLHGGDITASSAGLGCGAEFVVTLPLASAHEAEASAPHGSKAPALRRRVLVVDDSADNRESLQELLESLGHDVAVAADGFQAVDRICELQPEVAIVDIGLPGWDGYEVARRTRVKLGANVYLIALTGYGQTEDVQRADAAGFDAHVTKPADIGALRSLIEQRPRPGVRVA
jgi:signal transduction histidine kinase/CheY-like chemotaxis protein